MSNKNKSTKTNKILLIITFFIIISVPLLLQAFYGITGNKVDFELKGYADTYEFPELSAKSWMDGDYQTKFNEWVNNNFSSRGFFIKNWNQLNFSLFNLDTQGRILGKGNDIFEINYVSSELCIDDKNNFSLEENQILMQEYVNDLVEIDEKLQKNNKRLFFYITPSKAHTHRDNIPKKYFTLAGSDEKTNGYTYLTSLLDETDLLYLDSNDYLSELDGYPDFYSTGIHWTRNYEQIVNAAIIRKLSENSEEPSNEIVLKDMKSQSVPYWRDNDVYDLLNIYPEAKETYYEYNTEITKKEKTKPLRILLQGGSFTMGLPMMDYFNYCADSSCKRIFYKEYLTEDYYNQVNTFKEWDELDYQTLLDESDWVVIEINEAVISNYSSGFVSFFNDYLDTYVPGDISSYLDTKLSPADKTGLRESKGFYDYEPEYCWINRDGCLNLYNEKISENGLRIDYSPAVEIIGEDGVEVNVYVNGDLYKSENIKAAGSYTVVLTPEEIKSSDNHYLVEITSSKSFVPSEISDSEDMRELALQIHYVGENE